MSQLEKGGNINLLIDSSIFTPKSSLAVASDAGAMIPIPVNADTSASNTERLDPTAVASNLPAISPAEIEGLNIKAKKEQIVPDEGKVP